MDNYNPRQPTRMRWRDAKGLEKIKVIEVKNYSLVNSETYEKVSSVNEFKELINILKNMKDYSTQFPLILVNIVADDSESYTYLCMIPYDEQSEYNHVIHYIDSYTNSHTFYTLVYDSQKDTINISYVAENFLVEDDVKTIFGNYIQGTGDITLYRHQMTITNANDVSVVYIVNASDNSIINTLEKFVAVTKANTSYTGLASYLDASGNVQPAFIRYSAGNVIVQLQNGGISPMKSISDIVTPL